MYTATILAATRPQITSSTADHIQGHCFVRLRLDTDPDAWPQLEKGLRLPIEALCRDRERRRVRRQAERAHKAQQQHLKERDWVRAS